MGINLNFECVNCKEYEKAEKGKMGFCKVHLRKVAKTHSCRQNPILVSLRNELKGAA